MSSFIKSYWPEIVVFLLEILLVWIAARIAPFSTSTVSIDVLVPLQIAVFIAYAAVRGGLIERTAVKNFSDVTRLIQSSEKTQREIKSEIQDLFPRINSIKGLKQWEFYENFGRCIENATEAVDISHLDRHPPDENINRTKYFESFVERVRSNRRVEFRRVERLTEEKREWLSQLVEGLAEEKNFSMRVIVDDGPDKLPHISVQLVDHRVVFLVAVSTHKAPHGYRDIQIESDEVYQLWQEYYENILWGRAKPVIDRGKVVMDGILQVKRGNGS